MPKKNLPALPSAQKNKKFSPVSYTEEPSDIHAQKERELKKLKADQSELAGITQQLNRYRSDPLILLTQRETVSALEQRATDITNRYGSQSTLDEAVEKLSQQVNDPKLKYLNSPDYRSQYQRLLDLGAGGQSVQNNFAELEDLTPEERGAYNYYYYKHGKEKADAYLSDIRYDLNARRAAEIVEDTTIEDSPILGDILKLKQGYDAGIDTWQQNMRRSGDLLTGNDRYVAPSAQQMASSQIRQQMAQKGLASQMAYDVATGIGQMTPALMTSAVADLLLPGSGKVLGAGMMGLSSAGGAYQDAINRGYTPDQARGYGILTGASEAGLGYLLSGIGKLGGKVTGPMVQKLAGKVDNALLKAAATYGGNALSEFGEEYLQSVLSDVFQNLTLGTDKDIDLLSEEALYDGIIGALNSLVLGAGGDTFSQLNGIPDAQTIAEQNLMFKTQTGPGENIDFDRKGRAFDPVRESSFKVMDSIARATGKKFHIYESYVNQEGNRVYRNGEGQEVAAPNGFYKDGEFHIDLNAGETGEGTMLYTVAHELTHFIKEQSPDQFNALAEAAMEVHGESKDTLIQRQLEKAARNGIELTPEEALEEVVSDSMESMLQSGNVPQMLGKLSRKNMPLFQKVTSFLADTTTNLRSAVDAYRDFTPNTPEGRAIAQVSDAVGKLENIYIRAIADASENFKNGKFKANPNPRYSFLGYAEDGRGIYQGNFPKGTPKLAKSEHILDLIQNVWSKKPISTPIKDGDSYKIIEAAFDPTYDPEEGRQSDAKKLMGGNKHGNSTEKRVTLDLADDYYKLASEALHNYTKDEVGKTTTPHLGVKRWHYLVNDIYFAEYGENQLTPYRVSINVKEKDNGHYFYSFSAEKSGETTTPRTLHAEVSNSSDAVANGSFSKNSISQSSDENKPKNSLREQAVEQQYSRWLKEAEAAKGLYGDFDLGKELEDPRFRQLLQSGISVPDAYLVTHQAEVFLNAARAGVRIAEERVNRRVEENRRRPRENGLSPGAAFITRPSVSHMTRAQRQSIAHRAQKGEKIIF